MAEIPSKVADLLVAQIHNELYSHMAYLAMASYFEDAAYNGFAKWMRSQAMEEHSHAMKFLDYLYDRGVTVVLKGIQAPPTGFSSPLGVFKAAYAQEQAVTKMIYDIYEAAQSAKDFGTLEFLNWFLKEQVEEEDSTSNMVERLTLAGNSTEAILRLDHEAGAE